MPPSPRAALCPVTQEPVPDLDPDPDPDPEQAPRPAPYPRRRSGGRLALSLTLPGDPRSAAVARGVVTTALRAYGLASYTWPAALLASELVALNATLTPQRDLYLSLRHRDDALRLLVWDQHPDHACPGAAALCAQRRRRGLWLLAAVVDDWGGDWGVCDALPPQRGYKSWVVLPR
ncbi:ATP-binding protein [Streptomyces sp. NBC_00234]|uniref:ATP-binding protein n=1 Tax=Streptomyces sp. NBC_00234 TaxID=2903638 RepID=UPI002E2AC099|nr:ATP-binding protein [Streptomyces sp. NBC_00234]